MDTPYRNQSLLEDILSVCDERTRLCVALNLAGVDQTIQTRSIRDWKQSIIALAKTPCLFLLQKS